MYLFIEKSELPIQREREIERVGEKTGENLVHFSDGPQWPGWSQELGDSSRSPTWVMIFFIIYLLSMFRWCLLISKSQTRIFKIKQLEVNPICVKHFWQWFNFWNESFKYLHTEDALSPVFNLNRFAWNYVLCERELVFWINCEPLGRPSGLTITLWIVI